MKFLAILRDSLREAIDTWAFLVMVGLSLLVIALAATCTFTPKPDAKMVMDLATLPLVVDLDSISALDLDGDENPRRRMPTMRGIYRVTGVDVVDGEATPTSTFRITIQAGAEGPLAFLAGTPRPEKAKQDIRDRFGNYGDHQMLTISDVEAPTANQYVVTATLTPRGQRNWPHELSLFFGLLPIGTAVPLGSLLFLIESQVVNNIGAWVTILVSIVLTSFFIPNMLRKGTVDMLIVKPIHRLTLLAYKFLGGMLFITINTTLAVGGVWIALSARSGIWAPGFLISIPAIIFFFAILYSFSTLVGVVTRSPIVCILLTCGLWFFLFLVGTTNTISNVIGKQLTANARRNVAQLATLSITSMAANPGPAGVVPVTLVGGATLDPRKPLVYEENWFLKGIHVVHFVLPRTSELGILLDSQIQGELMSLPPGMLRLAAGTREISWIESLTVTGGFMALMLSIAGWWFATKDY